MTIALQVTRDAFDAIQLKINLESP